MLSRTWSQATSLTICNSHTQWQPQSHPQSHKPTHSLQKWSNSSSTVRRCGKRSRPLWRRGKASQHSFPPSQTTSSSTRCTLGTLRRLTPSTESGSTVPTINCSDGQQNTWVLVLNRSHTWSKTSVKNSRSSTPPSQSPTSRLH